eukprot:1625216-Pleurochrysis_carterae.AAC.10
MSAIKTGRPAHGTSSCRPGPVSSRSSPCRQTGTKRRGPRTEASSSRGRAPACMRVARLMECVNDARLVESWFEHSSETLHAAKHTTHHVMIRRIAAKNHKIHNLHDFSILPASKLQPCQNGVNGVLTGASLWRRTYPRGFRFTRRLNEHVFADEEAARERGCPVLL